MKQCDKQKSCSTKLPALFRKDVSLDLIGINGVCGEEAFLYIQAPCLLPADEI